MDYLADIGQILGAAVAVAGLIQWAKNWFKGAKPWVWALVLLPLAIGFAYLPERVQTGLLVAAIAQLGWDTLIKPAVKKLDGGQ
jgi:hypothetical protein